MPLFHQQNITPSTRLAIWKIKEAEDFFHLDVPLPQSITHPHKRLQHLAGRYLLPFLFPDFPNDEIKIADTRKPFLPNEQYHFSISHCSDYAAAIVSSKQRVGIDAELLTERLHKIKHKFLHVDEQQFVNAKPQQEQLTYLSILWSAKEAMFKWYGEGEVDFSDMMRIMPFELKDKGEIRGQFSSLRIKQNLVVHYQLINQLTLVWIAT